MNEIDWQSRNRRQGSDLGDPTRGRNMRYHNRSEDEPWLSRAWEWLNENRVIAVCLALLIIWFGWDTVSSYVSGR